MSTIGRGLSCYQHGDLPAAFVPLSELEPERAQAVRVRNLELMAERDVLEC